MKILKRVLPVFAAILVLAVPARSEIFRGTASMLGGGTWVFKDSNCGCPPCMYACSHLETSRLDFEWAYVVDPPPEGNALAMPSGGQPLGDVPLDSVKVAPTNDYVGLIWAGMNEEFQVNHTYVLKTRDGGHALIRPTVLDESNFHFVFEYIYQNDGTGIFKAGTAVHITTWGSLKIRFSE